MADASSQDVQPEEPCEGAYDVIQLPLLAPSAPQPIKPWNILFYAAADFEQGFNPVLSFAAEVTSGPQTNVLIHEDQYSFTEDDVIWLVDHQTCSVSITPVFNVGEAHADESATLERFLRFAEEWFPAERTLLYMYGHGGAWEGACNDETNGETTCGSVPCDWLTPLEMRAALEAVGGVDALMFSAPCNMSSLEAAYELRHVVKLWVGSEEISGYLFWWDAVGPIAASLEEDPYQGVLDLGRFTVDTIRETMKVKLESGNYTHLFTRLPNIAATDVSVLQELAAAVDSLAKSALALLPEQTDAIMEARRHSPQFRFGDLVDVRAFAESCQRIPGLSEAAASVMQAFDQAVIAQVAPSLSPFGDSGGLSLYFPNPAGTFRFVMSEGNSSVYANYGLALPADTHWDELLEALFEWVPAP